MGYRIQNFHRYLRNFEAQICRKTLTYIEDIQEAVFNSDLLTERLIINLRHAVPMH